MILYGYVDKGINVHESAKQSVYWVTMDINSPLERENPSIPVQLSQHYRAMIKKRVNSLEIPSIAYILSIINI